MSNLRSNVPPDRSTGLAGEPSGEHPTRCAGCAAIYSASLWKSLSLVTRIEAPEVARLVLDWPMGWAIEVRSCSNCGSSLARKRRASWCE